MILIGYTLNPAFESWMRQNNLLRTSEADLRVNAARGDLALQVNGVDFTTRTGEVALIDFACGLARVCTALAQKEGTEEVLTVGDSLNDIRFSRTDAKVTVRCSYAEGDAKASLAELKNTCVALKTRLQQDLTARYPALIGNANFRALMVPPA